MHPPMIRAATLLDLPRILEITLAALPEDPFYTYLWTLREEFPNDHQGYWLQRLQADLYNPSYEVVVAEVEGGRVGGNPVVAFGIWERRGEDEDAKRRRGWKGNGEEASGNFHCQTLYNLLHPPPPYPQLRACLPARLSACTTALDQVTSYYDSLYPSRFSLELLCTHPKHQRNGMGTAIVQWGLEEARREGVPVSVAASPGGESLYRVAGFGGGREWSVGVQGEGEEVRFLTLIWGVVE